MSLKKRISNFFNHSAMIKFFTVDDPHLRLKTFFVVSIFGFFFLAWNVAGDTKYWLVNLAFYFKTIFLIVLWFLLNALVNFYFLLRGWMVGRGWLKEEQQNQKVEIPENTFLKSILGWVLNSQGRRIWGIIGFYFLTAIIIVLIFRFPRFENLLFTVGVVFVLTAYLIAYLGGKIKKSGRSNLSVVLSPSQILFYILFAGSPLVLMFLNNLFRP